MRSLYLTILSVVSLYSAELIHVSNSIDNDTLLTLEQRYGESIIIDDNRAYLAPQECIVNRYFGGVSENTLILPKSSTYTAPVTITKEVFEAKSVKEIEVEINKKKIIDKIEGKLAKAFLEDTTGHLYGGISQVPIDLTEQKIVVKKDNKVTVKLDKYIVPKCKLLDDGSGYKITNINNPSLYKNNSIKSILNNVILFD